MSSAATAGPSPNNHPYHNANGGGRPVDVTNGFKHDGSPGKRSGKVFKHIQDLVAARPNVDINAPIRKILLAGEAHAKSAESSFDFRRPDLALEEYLKASIITVEIIPRHKDYPELQSDRGELHRLYVGLKKRISSQQDRFDEAKILIKENNAQNGTQPAILINPIIGSSQDVRPQTDFFDKIGDKGRSSNGVDVGKENGVGNSILETSSSRSINQSKSNDEPGSIKMPAIHPKPEALQGRSIKLKTTSSQTTPQAFEDLTTRFARLRGAENKSQLGDLPSEVAPIQDPRIKTRPILIPPNTASTAIQSHSRGGSLSSRSNRSLGPRDLPFAPSRPLKIALGVEIPEMPRPPEAVYSPARSLDNNSHAAMQNPTFFNNSLRTLSTDSTKDAGHGFVHDSNPYFYSSPITPSATTKKPRLPDLSTLKSVTATQLQQFMQIGSQGLSILLVDIRDRENFDNGHIMWHSIICIEPIALREGISADDLEQSLVISPEAEQGLYSQRQDFSLLVYYDQSTSSSSQSPRHINDQTLLTFKKAVYDYSYDKSLKNQPLLLEGGLDAWVDLIGIGALATSKSAAAQRVNGLNTTNSLPPARAAPQPRNGTASLARENQSHSNNKSRSQEYFASGPVAQRDDSTDDFYFKTADDFMRRFPAVSDIKESMISPSNQLILASTGPVRPPQAFAPGNSMFSRLISDKLATDVLSPGRGQWGNGRVGLQNKGNLCYMLAAIQALSSIHELRDFLLRGAWLKNLQPDPSLFTLEEQQLGTKTLSNLLMHLWSKGSEPPACSHINPRTFVATIHRLHIHERQGTRDNDVFGGPNQQDSQEFLGFLIEKCCNETSPPKPPRKQYSPEEENQLERQLDESKDVAEASKIAYERLNPTIRSPIGKLLDSCSMKNHYCQLCRKFTRVFDNAFSHFTVANFPENQSAVTLESLLETGQTIPIPDYNCRYCNTRGGVSLMGTFYVKFPDILIIHLARGKSDLQGFTSKVTAQVNFPETGLDLTRSQPPGGNETSIKYDCFAVICHIGSSLKGGHYITHRRDMVNGRYENWWEFDDNVVRSSSFASINKAQAYVLFYRRQGTGVPK